jgi:serine/threonine-protein kinase
MLDREARLSYPEATFSTQGGSPLNHPDTQATTLDQSTSATLPSQTADGARFVVLRHHAEGGLGRVNVARDQHLGRDVALKEIRPDRRGNGTLRRRFLREAEITARLEHPGVVPVYALERDSDGEPRYAMRFIQGHDLAEASRRFHASKADFTSLAFRDLLQRFVSVCQTMAYAHSKGVIHRDLKPANIMLGDYGETLVVDWGIAKLIGEADPVSDSDAPSEEGALTAEGSLLGTVGYMAPEQARGEPVDRTADVFALGAILYTLLTDSAPYASGEFGRRLALARAGRFPPPGQVRRGVPPALQAICLKAMAATPAGRYADAGDLARDVTAYLADEPVGAYREPWRVRARRWMRRHPTWTAGVAATLLVGLLALGIGLAIVSGLNSQLEQSNRDLGKSNRAKDEALEKEKKEREAKGVALEMERKEREAKVLALNKAIRSARRALHTLESMTSEETQSAIERQRELRPEQRAFLERVVEFYREEAQEAGSDEEGRARMGSAYFQMARLQHRLNLNAVARATYEQAIDAREKLIADFPRASRVAEYRRDLATTYNNLGNLLNDLGEFVASRAAYERAIVLQEKFIEDFPDILGCRLDLARSLVNLSGTLQPLNEFSAARKALDRSLDVLQKLVDDHPRVPLYRRMLAGSQHSLGVLLIGMGDPSTARKRMEEAITLQQKLADEFPGRSDYSLALTTSLNNLGTLLLQMDDLDAAQRISERAQTRSKKLTDEFPAVPEYRQELATSYNNRGKLLMRLGALPAALEAFERCIPLRQRLVDDFPTIPQYRLELASSQGSFGQFLTQVGELPAARRVIEQARGHFQKLADTYPDVADYRLNLARTHWDLGRILWRMNQFPAARQAFEQAIALEQKLVNEHRKVPGYRQELAVTFEDLGSLLWQLDLDREAMRAHRQALALQQGLVDDFPDNRAYRVDLAGSLCNLGKALAPINAKEALPHLDKAQELLRVVLKQQPRNETARQFLRNTIWNRAAALDLLGRYPEALADWDEAFQLDNGPNRATLRRNRRNTEVKEALTRDLAWPLLWGRPIH